MKDGSLVITVGGVDDPIVIYSPSTDRLQGEPIIERLGIVFASVREGRKIIGWRSALKSGSKFGFNSPTTLVAAMRLCVENGLGQEVDVPDELYYEKHTPQTEYGPEV